MFKNKDNLLIFRINKSDVIAETNNSILIKNDLLEKKIWLPKNKCFNNQFALFFTFSAQNDFNIIDENKKPVLFGDVFKEWTLNYSKKFNKQYEI